MIYLSVSVASSTAKVLNIILLQLHLLYNDIECSQYVPEHRMIISEFIISHGISSRRSYFLIKILLITIKFNFCKQCL